MALHDVAPGAGWRTHVPTFAGFSADPTGFTCLYQLTDGWCFLMYTSSSAGTSNATTFTMTLPIAPVFGTSYPVRIRDNGSVQVDPGLARTSGSSTTLTLGKTLAADGGFTASGTKDASFLIVYPL